MKYADKEQRLDRMANRIQRGNHQKAREESTRIFLFEYFPTHCPANGRITIAAAKKHVTNSPALSAEACRRSAI